MATAAGSVPVSQVTVTRGRGTPGKGQGALQIVTPGGLAGKALQTGHGATPVVKVDFLPVKKEIWRKKGAERLAALSPTAETNAQTPVAAGSRAVGTPRVVPGSRPP